MACSVSTDLILVSEEILFLTVACLKQATVLIPCLLRSCARLSRVIVRLRSTSKLLERKLNKPSLKIPLLILHAQELPQMTKALRPPSQPLSFQLIINPRTHTRADRSLYTLMLSSPQTLETIFPTKMVCSPQLKPPNSVPCAPRIREPLATLNLSSPKLTTPSSPITTMISSSPWRLCKSRLLLSLTFRRRNLNKKMHSRRSTRRQ